MSKTDTRTNDVPKTEAPADEDAEAQDAPEPEAADEPGIEDEPKAVSTKPVAKVAGSSEKADGGRRSWRGVPVKAWLVRATVAVAVAGSAVTAGLQWHAADQAAQRDKERQEVRASAAEFGQALLSYDHTKLQDARHRVLALATDDFAKTYDEAFTGGLEGVITKLKADATAEVQAVYLEKIQDGAAKAVVVMDSEVHSTAGTRRVLGSYLDMRLVRRGGAWKVTDVTSVGAANESMTDPDGKRQQQPGAAVPTPEKTP
ncbi:hypothetical protein [Actinomadura bangladeshensis]|uniref:Mce-associated membrane protein n=1 Tax=Actinomadura bangladeshensis TaxID=453573 RepID=A0A4R4NKA8_9ACTN|nr:hypothetical protein [Actinomadura bangladeshensis]TDC09801.1 hypothetical protein E1284_28940 [Actinomadura bangladeshensis]